LGQGYINSESVRERQARVVKIGEEWEAYVKSFLDAELKTTDIEVVVGKNEDAIRKKSQTLWRLLSIPVKTSPSQDHIWGDVDLVAVRGEFPVSVISCKLSLHGRFTETLFWSLLYRLQTRTKVVLATPDAGRGKVGEWKSEWGTPDNPTKDRLLAEAFLDGVYVENVKSFCRNIRAGEGTAMGGVIRPLDELPSDIVMWGKDISRFIGTLGRRGQQRFR